MMMEAAPAASLIVAEPGLLLEFDIAGFDTPAQFCVTEPALQRDVGRQRGSQ